MAFIPADSSAEMISVRPVDARCDGKNPRLPTITPKVMVLLMVLVSLVSSRDLAQRYKYLSNVYMLRLQHLRSSCAERKKYTAIERVELLIDSHSLRLRCECPVPEAELLLGHFNRGE